MAQTLSYLNSKGAPVALRSVGLLALSVVLTADTYATASGGVTVDLATPLLNACQKGVAAADVVLITGTSTDGYKAVFTYVSGTSWTMRLYTSGASEIADGAVTKTVKALVWIAGGSLV